MSKKDKLIKKLKSNSSITFDEVESLLFFFDYHMDNKGKTSESRVVFINNETGCKLVLHKPHPGNELKKYQKKQMIDHLKREGLI